MRGAEMATGDGCCRVCCRGFYSCYWKYPSERKRKCACCWLSVITMVTLFTFCWMYICMVTFNDREDVNWEGFRLLRQWVNWFAVVIILSAMLTCYCVLLLLFALFHVALKEPLDLHWLHKIFLLLSVLFITFGVTGISLRWKQEWPTVPLSLQATAPFLQMGGVGALTLLCWPMFQVFHRADRRGSKLLIIGSFAVVSVAIFLSPLFIYSPCLIEVSELPPRPALIGHRGASMLAPENTMMSFRRSVECHVTAFETDVQLSNDGFPFLMHDHGKGFLRRTTNVLERFPGKDFNHSRDLTWEELQSLNAGDWFLKTDPFHSVSRLSQQEKEMAANQSIPHLHHLLDLAYEHKTAVIFDLKKDNHSAKNDDNDTRDTVNSILASGVPPNLIYWLPPAERDYVIEMAPGFIQVYDNMTEMDEDGGNHLNLKYSTLSATEIRELRSRNVSVNLWVVNERWLFSLLWCSGASSVTTNACHLLQDMTQPDWTLGPGTYKCIWITVNLVSLLIMFGLFILQSVSQETNVRACSKEAYSRRGRRTGRVSLMDKSMGGKWRRAATSETCKWMEPSGTACEQT